MMDLSAFVEYGLGAAALYLVRDLTLRILRDRISEREDRARERAEDRQDARAGRDASQTHQTLILSRIADVESAVADVRMRVARISTRETDDLDTRVDRRP